MPAAGEKPVMEGWELTALFLVFLLITLSWDFLVGILTFLNNILRGRKANWLARVKEELLALGVVSLVLLFLEPSLQKICIPLHKTQDALGAVPPSPPPPPVAYGTYSCVYGYRQVFPKTAIHAAHYLLFYLAMVHILFSLLTSVVTNIKLSKWSALERTARKEANIPAVLVLRMSSVIMRANDPTNRRLAIRLRDAWRDAHGFVDQDLYSLLRFMCEKRFRAHHVVLRNFNFLNMCEQCLEAELNEVYSHAWLLVFMMALLLLYNQKVYQLIWISCLCAALMALMSGNMRWVMKKTAREARNLWRKVKGLGGLEVDGDSQLQLEAEGGTGLMAMMGVGVGGGVYGNGGVMTTLGGGVSGDLELGDVGSRRGGHDQLRQLNGGVGLGSTSKRLRFAPRAVGEATELPLQQNEQDSPTIAPHPQQQDSAALNALINGGHMTHGSAACVAASHEHRTRALPTPRPQPPGHCGLVDLLEGCRAASMRGTEVLKWHDAPRSSCRTPRSVDRDRGPRPGGLMSFFFRRLSTRRSSERRGGRGRMGPLGGVGRRMAESRHRREPGPVAEATVSNPLYSPGGSDGGGLHMSAAGLGVPYMQTVSSVGMPSGGMYGMYNSMQGGDGAYGLYNGGAASAGPPGAGFMVAAAAAAPYGGGGAAAAAAAGTGVTLTENGQWGSNPSSGSPEEADESSVSGSGSSSSYSEGAPTRARSGLGKSAGHGGAPSDDEEDIHSEKSMLEHELASGIEEKITRLFFFGRPFLLLWLFNIIFAQASLTMTMSMAFVIPYDKFDSIRDVAMHLYIWLPVVIMNLVLVMYGCWVFLPQYALLSVSGILEPHEVMHEIKRSKTADFEEEGVAGIVLEKLTAYFIGHHDGETRVSTAFIVMLASQAGIILGRDYKAARLINKASLKPMYQELIAVWHDIAWYGDLPEPYNIKTDIPEFKEAFDELDEDGSGQLSFGELANMIRSLGTYATTGDVEAMLWEIDIDNSHSIGFDEFVKFMTYSFFDSKQLGYIDVPLLLDAMERLGQPINEMQAAVLMSVGNSEPGEDPKVTLREFFNMFEKVEFDDGDSEGEDVEGGGGSLVARARDALRRPSILFTGIKGASATGRAGEGGSREGTPHVSQNGMAGGRQQTPGGGGGSGTMRDSRTGKSPSRLAVVSHP